MSLFSRNKEEEFDDEEGFTEEEKLSDRKLTRKFRDLHSENKKKRKEPPKPWGKKERFIVLGFFLTTTVLAAGMFLFSHDLKFPGIPRIAFSGINLKNPFGEEVIEIGQKRPAAQNDINVQEITSVFRQETLA